MTAETDAEFVERVEANAIIAGADLSRLFALARRGAEMNRAAAETWKEQTIGHLDNAERAALRAAMALKIDEKYFLAAVDREGDHEVGAGKMPLPPPPKENE